MITEDDRRVVTGSPAVVDDVDVAAMLSPMVLFSPITHPSPICTGPSNE
jgi:hypothetical protein